VIDNILIFANYHGLSAKQSKISARELIRFVQLEESERRVVGSLSLSAQKRVALARALINQPKIIFLDEPTKGLSLEEKNRFWTIIRRIKTDGVTVVLSSSSVHEVEELCDQVLLLDQGAVVAEGVPTQMVEEEIGKEVVDFHIRTDDLEYYLNKIGKEFECQVLGSSIRLFVNNSEDRKRAITSIVSDKIQIRKSSLEDLYLRLTGNEFCGEGNSC
jgi:lipooligosaccharide transport system ATP-binding protein